MPQEIQNLSHNFPLVLSQQYIFSLFIVQVMSCKNHFLSLTVGVIHFPILGKNFPQPYLIFIRECPQNNITHINILQ